MVRVKSKLIFYQYNYRYSDNPGLLDLFLSMRVSFKKFPPPLLLGIIVYNKYFFMKSMVNIDLLVIKCKI